MDRENFSLVKSTKPLPRSGYHLASFSLRKHKFLKVLLRCEAILAGGVHGGSSTDRAASHTKNEREGTNSTNLNVRLEKKMCFGWFEWAPF